MNRRLVVLVVVERRKLPFMPWKRIRTGNFAPKFPEATQSDDVQNLVTDAMESIPYSVFSIGTDKNPFKRVGMPEYCRLVDAIQKKCEHHRQFTIPSRNNISKITHIN